MPKVAVIVPNYCHAPYLEWRLDSVLGQTYRDFELLILDDASTDHSREIIERYRDRPGVRTLYNQRNSGSVFRQWQAGIDATDSDYVWIAESDDWADPGFLAALVPVLEAHPRVGAAQCQSWIADTRFQVNGHASCWTDDLDAERWRHDFVADGREEIRRHLLVKNTIPNASAVLMRRSHLEQVLPIDTSFRLCGDWMHWIRLLLQSDLAFVAANLNFWRLQSSHARTAAPGVLEWEEGQRILHHACDRLELGAAERVRVLADFEAKCRQWTAAAAVPVAAHAG